MNTARPIVATTTLSILLHGVVFAALLLVYGKLIAPGEGVGKGLEIQLISSTLISDQQETSEYGRYEAELAVQDKNSFDSIQHTASNKVISASNSVEKIQFETLADEERVGNEITVWQQ